MPNEASTSNTNASDAPSGPKTNYAYTKPYGGMQGFMNSYGLKIWNDDDVQEAKAILDGFRMCDAEEAAPAAQEAETSTLNTDASDAPSRSKTNYAYTKPYGGMQGFMNSYGLKIWNNDDVQEAKAILDGFRMCDAEEAAQEADKANSE